MGLPPPPATLPTPPAAPPPPRNLRILVLGGTSFIGPHQVEYALSRGHEVTLFNRGRTNTHLFPGLEKLVGDRNGDLTALQGRSWDVVIDNSATNPRWVELSAGLLKDTLRALHLRLHTVGGTPTPAGSP